MSVWKLRKRDWLIDCLFTRVSRNSFLASSCAQRVWAIEKLRTNIHIAKCITRLIRIPDLLIIGITYTLHPVYLKLQILIRISRDTSSISSTESSPSVFIIWNFSRPVIGDPLWYLWLVRDYSYYKYTRFTMGGQELIRAILHPHICWNPRYLSVICHRVFVIPHFTSSILIKLLSDAFKPLREVSKSMSTRNNPLSHFNKSV